MKTSLIRHIDFTVDKARIPFFFVFFGYGIKLAVETGRTLRDVLCRQLGMDAAYVDSQVQTLFLNAKAVDDVDRTTVPTGAIIALSAAMPGLAGAVFRKGGILASLRSKPPAAAAPPDEKAPTGTVTLKLFNHVAADFGPAFLARGVRIEGGQFKRFFEKNRQTLTTIGCRMEIDGESCDVADARIDGETDDVIVLRVRPA